MNRLKWICVFLAGSLLLSTVVNCFLISQIRGFYERQLSAQIWPAGIETAPVISDNPTTFTSTVLLFGDSRIADWKLPPASGIRIINAGVSGATTAQLRLRLPVLLDAWQPDCVVVQAGINDLKFLGLHPELTDSLVAETGSNLTVIVNQCAEHKCKVLLLATWPVINPDGPRRLVWNPAIPAAVTALNRRLILLQNPDKSVRVIDLLNEANITPDKTTYRDAIHPNPVAYQKITPLLLQEIQRQNKNSTNQSSNH